MESKLAIQRAIRSRPNPRGFWTCACLLGLSVVSWDAELLADENNAPAATKSVPQMFRLPAVEQAAQNSPSALNHSHRLPQVLPSKANNTAVNLFAPGNTTEGTVPTPRSIKSRPARGVGDIPSPWAKKVKSKPKTPISVPTPRQIQPKAKPRASQIEQIPAPAGDTSGKETAQLSTVQALLSEEIRSPYYDPGKPVGNDQWWTPQIRESMRYSSEKIPAGIDQLIQLALQHSEQLKVYSEVPRIRATSIIEADAAFDWNQFIHSAWDDISDPVGNVLTVGPDRNRFNDHNVRVDTGLRRKNRYGADVEFAQELGHQNNNSVFFVPNDQATSRITFSFTQPLLRGRGKVYNESLIVLAGIDTKVARDEFERQLETHLLEVARAYWALYLERGSLTQKVKLYQRTKEIAEQLERRQHIDTGQTQLISARAALSERKSELIRASAAVRNAETRIRGLLNAPSLGTTDQVELLPMDEPVTEFIPFQLYDSVHTAIQHRSEILQAIKQIRAGCVRLNMADHEMLPTLNLVTQTYVAGLQGQSDIGAAWSQQFTEGAPSYSIGLEYELPVGRRANTARLQRRRIELRQLNSQYRNALETVKNEVEIAVREVNTAYSEMGAKAKAMLAAAKDSESRELRWRKLADQNTTTALTLESLLRAQERLTQTEFDFLSAQLTYNLALIHMKRAMGILVSMNRCGAVAASAH